MNDVPWFEEFPAPITVTDATGTILAMNAASRRLFAADGGGALVGRSVFDCHPEPALTRTRALYASRQPNHYTVRSRGVRKIIHQLPWSSGGVFGGFVEISVVIPEELPHHDRDDAVARRSRRRRSSPRRGGPSKRKAEKEEGGPKPPLP